MIELPPTPRGLVVMWPEPRGHRYLPVARLARIPGAGGGGIYEFSYVRGVEDAQKQGFSAIVPFEDIRRTYRSARLFPFFQNRLMSEGRPDYAGYLERLLLRESPADPMEVLSRSGGVRATDPYELAPIPRWDDRLPGFRTLFLLQSLGYLPDRAHERLRMLQPGDRLGIVREGADASDPGVLALRTNDQVVVGYVPSYLLPELFGLSGPDLPIEIHVAKVNRPPAPLDERVLCLMETCWPPAQHPFAHERYRPLPEDAVPTADLIEDPRLGQVA